MRVHAAVQQSDMVCDLELILTDLDTLCKTQMILNIISESVNSVEGRLAGLECLKGVREGWYAAVEDDSFESGGVVGLHDLDIAREKEGRGCRCCLLRKEW